MLNPSERPLSASVLADVNRIRAQYGHGPLEDLRRGARECSWRCPIAMSIAETGLQVSVLPDCITVMVRGYTRRFDTTPEMQLFIQLFDNKDRAYLRYYRG